jgi:hypothetical protein
LRDDRATFGVPYVLAEHPSHAWWRPAGALGSAYALAEAAPWQATQPGRWQPLVRRLREGQTECWWALAAEGGPSGRDQATRLVLARTAPTALPEAPTWYLVTPLPALGAATPHAPAPAAVAAVVRLYGLRVWVEQSDTPVTQPLGWAPSQGRAALALRRHWP